MKIRLSLFLLGGLFALSIVLAACGANAAGQASVSTTSTRTTVATPATSSATAVYTGKGYRINYPSGWEKKPYVEDGVLFQDPGQEGTELHVMTQNTQTPEPAFALEEGTSGKYRCRVVSNVPATITLDGAPWDQREYRCASGRAGGPDQAIRTQRNR